MISLLTILELPVLPKETITLEMLNGPFLVSFSDGGYIMRTKSSLFAAHDVKCPYCQRDTAIWAPQSYRSPLCCAPMKRPGLVARVMRFPLGQDKTQTGTVESADLSTSHNFEKLPSSSTKLDTSGNIAQQKYHSR